MNFLDSVLPIYVDYLGRYDWVPGEVESPADVMKALLDRGVTDRRNFLPNGEVSSSGQDGNLMLRDNVRQVGVKKITKKVRARYFPAYKRFFLEGKEFTPSILFALPLS